MISGAFKSMVHDHDFAADHAGTIMRDRFEFNSPLGILGGMFDAIFLKSCLRRFLIRRNEVLKRLSESDGWNRYLKT
jgi:ligand-binding SRPBCC domain-containing protein